MTTHKSSAWPLVQEVKHSLTLILTFIFQTDMAVNLVELFMEKVEERCRLATEVR